ncbi:hypothetical protein [Litorimonas taeanensis]|uniref:hypothetical protein n=1 Tax=Litorimonas taeanensis TaxID=568099 RepID=UPI000EAB9EA2|nr:hypothetical protein [Litorimonas taeanensis]
MTTSTHSLPAEAFDTSKLYPKAHSRTQLVSEGPPYTEKAQKAVRHIEGWKNLAATLCSDASDSLPVQDGLTRHQQYKSLISAA